MNGHPDTWIAPGDPYSLIMVKHRGEKYMYRKGKWRKVLPQRIGDGILLDGAYVSNVEILTKPRRKA